MYSFNIITLSNGLQKIFFVIVVHEAAHNGRAFPEICDWAVLVLTCNKNLKWAHSGLNSNLKEYLRNPLQFIVITHYKGNFFL